MRVYCDYCKHDKYEDDGFGGYVWCNVVVGIKHTIHAPSKIYLKKEVGNKNNNCKHFYPSLITRWSKSRQRRMEAK